MRREVSKETLWSQPCFSGRSVCVCEFVWLFRSEFVHRLRISSMGAFSRRVFERLVEVKLLSTARRRERTDERPLHHPNGIHKALNQPCCLGFGWAKGKERLRYGGGGGKEERRARPHTRSEDHTENMHGSGNANTTVQPGVSWSGLWAVSGSSQICPLGSGTELMPFCPQDGRTCDPCWPLAQSQRQRIKGWESLKSNFITRIHLNR